MSWLFGRKAAPDVLRPFVPAWLRTGEEEGFSRSFDVQFDEVYRKNPVGQRSVRLVYAAVAAALGMQLVIDSALLTSETVVLL